MNRALKYAISTIGILLLLAGLIKVVVSPYRISGDCMEPAVMDGQLRFCNRLYSYIWDYQIDDIVVFTHEGRPWFSRIAALEGDTICIEHGTIIINGVQKNDNISRNWSGWNSGTHALNQSFVVPKDHVFVLSDNLSAQHDDSRQFGPIHKQKISCLLW